MRAIHIIESTTDTPILSVESFGLFDDKNEMEVIAKAEENFKFKAIENGCNEKDVESHVEDGHFARRDGYSVNIVWGKLE